MKYISLILFLSTSLFADIFVEKTVSMMQGEHSTNKVMELLLQKAKREAASEIFGDFITASTKIENGRLSNDSMLALVVGKIHVKGTPKYANGDGFTEVKVTITAYATSDEISQAKKVLDQRIAALQKAEQETPEIVSSKFKAVIKTSKGGKQDIFYDGEEIELYILLNQPGYYYITGEIIVEGKRLTYLVDLDDSDGINKFVRHVNAEDTNKWVSLGSFTVEAPFGTENLQIFASSKVIKHVPRHNYDDNYGYYFIVDILNKVIKTRGIKKKNKSDLKLSRSKLQFTTVRK